MRTRVLLLQKNKKKKKKLEKKKRRQKEVFEEIAAGVAGQFDVGEWQVHFVEKGGFNWTKMEEEEGWLFWA